LVFFTVSTGCSNKLERSIKNIEAFTRLYGYVKYFYPGDKAAAMDWDRFAIYGVKRVENASGSAELKNVLEELFLPVAPALVIHESNKKTEFSIASITPPNEDGMKLVAWQHLGVGLGNLKNIYKSVRINRKNEFSASTAAMGSKSVSIKSKSDRIPGALPGFNEFPKMGEYISKDLGASLSCVMPIALQGTEAYTYPQSPKQELEQLKTAVKKEVPGELSGDDLYVRLANICITWNIFQHFYPYFDVVKTDWRAALTEALKDAYQDKTKKDFLKTLRKFTAKLNDGHVRIYLHGDTTESYLLPIRWDWIENQLVITDIYDQTITNIHIGDVVVEINGVTAKEARENEEQYISAATGGWKRYRSLNALLSGEKDAEFHLKIKRDGKTFDKTIHASLSMKEYYSLSRKDIVNHKEIEAGIHYLNLDAISMAEINKLMPELEKAKAIICDLRGYPKGNHGLINHLLKEKEDSRWMFVPQVIYPDYEKVTYQEFGWQMQPVEPALTAKVVFITNGRAISYAESVMGYIEGFQLATIVGQPTAGTNGNVNSFTLPGGYRIGWTGMRVLKHDGSPHHGVGISPHVLVERTIKGVKAGRDEFLEKAIEIAKQ
jgi:C-terminal processing protease CtpA/Prc